VRSAPRAKFIAESSAAGNNRGADSGNGADSVKNRKWMDMMLNKLLAAAAMAAIAYAVVPANAARMNAGCSGTSLTKTESSIEAMADGEGKIAAQKEVALAQDAMLNGKMATCGMHLSKAMQDAGMAK
jgi:hypothetical protein